MPDSIIEQRKKRWNDFISMNTPIKNVLMVNYDVGSPVHPPFWPDKKTERIEWAWELYNRQMEQMQWLDDDKIPFLDNLTGTEVFAEAFGCKVHRAKDNMPFALPLVQNATEASKLKVPDLSVSSLAVLFDIADELKRRAGDDAIMRLPDIQSPMDIAALIWDKNDFYIALIEEPEAVKELARKVRTLLFTFLDEWFKRYGTEFISHFPTYYMSKGITLSEDEVGVINPGMFEEYFLPELVELSNRYGGIGMHCCAHARHQWDNFKKIPNLKLLNFVQPIETLIEAYDFFKDHTAQWHSWIGDGPAWMWADQRPPEARFIIETWANTKHEAIETTKRLREVYK